MKRLYCISSSLLILSLAGNCYGHFTGKGHVHTISDTKQVFLNPDCRSSATCDLKRFTLATSVYEFWFSDDPKHPTYGNGVVMEYETDAVAAVEKYTIVQFKKGCVFYSSRNSQGRIHRTVSDTVLSFGEDVPFCFPKWVIDSQDTDPAYNSDPEHGRFYLLRWNNPGSYDDRTQKFYGAEKPKDPVVYMTDYPAGAFVGGTAVKNVALEFNTCIYRTRDVPAQTRRDETNFARPLTCFRWQNVYVYDFASGRFQTQWAGVPWWEEPERRVDRYAVAVFMALFIALAVVAYSRLGRSSAKKIRVPNRFPTDGGL